MAPAGTSRLEACKNEVTGPNLPQQVLRLGKSLIDQRSTSAHQYNPCSPSRYALQDMETSVYGTGTEGYWGYYCAIEIGKAPSNPKFHRRRVNIPSQLASCWPLDHPAPCPSGLTNILMVWRPYFVISHCGVPRFHLYWDTYIMGASCACRTSLSLLLLGLLTFRSCI